MASYRGGLPKDIAAAISRSKVSLVVFCHYGASNVALISSAVF
jgi:hypothetical protein